MAAAAYPVLEFDAYADAIADAGVVLRDNAARAGLGASVPTCPGWTVRDLVVHQSTVHRWARASVLGERVDTGAIEAEGAEQGDVLNWLDEGMQDLLRTLDRTPEGHEGWFFLADPLPTRLAWARRQCHETTMHAVDAMSAALGGAPTSRQLWFGTALAADGVDELLTGFLPRERTRFRPSSPVRVLVSTVDADRSWLLDLDPDRVPTVERAPADPAYDTAWRGHAADLLLSLWNRAPASDRVVEDGAPVLEQWQQGMAVTFR